jgi:hypothetical protein
MTHTRTTSQHWTGYHRPDLAHRYQGFNEYKKAYRAELAGYSP